MLHLRLEVADGILSAGGVNYKKRSGFRPRKPTEIRKMSSEGAGAVDEDERSHGAIVIETYKQDPRTEIVKFRSGNPAVKIESGLLHLYKEGSVEQGNLPEPRLPMLCILAVPNHILPADLIEWCGAFLERMEHIRIIRDASPNRFMVVITFREQACADEFYAEYHTKPFNMLEPEVAYIGYIAAMEIIESSDAAKEDPPAGLTELPTCPVCLERMDSRVNNIITILCNHSFHSECLSRWGDSACPVCRYCERSKDNENTCIDCHTTEQLWICLICGFVGCGRYKDSHAEAHFNEKGHTYAMELETTRVWDYANDGYVHRLIQSKTDGELVELPDANAPGPDSKVASVDAKLSMEFDHLLVTQLESQRMFFEREIEQLIDDKSSCTQRLQQRLQQMESKVQHLEKERRLSEKKALGRIGKMEEESMFLNEVNASLLADQAKWQEQVEAAKRSASQKEAEKDEEIAALQEQIRDLMFFVETRDKVEASPKEHRRELQGGTVVVEQGSTPSPGGARSSPSSGKKNKKKKKKKT